MVRKQPDPKYSSWAINISPRVEDINPEMERVIVSYLSRKFKYGLIVMEKDSHFHCGGITHEPVTRANFLSTFGDQKWGPAEVNAETREQTLLPAKAYPHKDIVYSGKEAFKLMYNDDFVNTYCVKGFHDQPEQHTRIVWKNLPSEDPTDEIWDSEWRAFYPPKGDTGLLRKFEGTPKYIQLKALWAEYGETDTRWSRLTLPRVTAFLEEMMFGEEPRINVIEDPRKLLWTAKALLKFIKYEPKTELDLEMEDTELETGYTRAQLFELRDRLANTERGDPDYVS